MLKKIFIAIFVSATALVAQARGILVSPVQVMLSAAAGENASGVIRVSSSKPEVNQVRDRITDFTRDENGRIVRVPSNPRSCSGWIEIDKINFETPADGPVELRVVAHVPKDAAGSYWTLVTLESIPKQGPSKPNVLQVVPSVAVPIYVTVTGTEKSGVRVVDTQAVQRADRDVIDSWAVVENTGNVVVPLTGAFALEHPTPDGGEEFASGGFIPTILLPGTKAKVQVEMPWKGSSAGLQMHAYLRYGGGVEDATEAVIAIVDEFKGTRPPNPAARLFPKPDGNSPQKKPGITP